jgi:cell division protein FtsQ
LKKKYSGNEMPRVADRKYKRKARRRKRALKFIRNLLLTVLLVGTLVLLALSPLFEISSISVSGNIHYEESEIIGVTNLALGNNWFKTNGLDLKSILLFRSVEAEKRIRENCHYVKKVTVRLIIPDKVRINLTEREPYVISPYDDEFMILDKEGYMLDLRKDISNYNLPMINGLNFDNCQLGQAINAEDRKKFDIYKNVVAEINNLDNDKVYDSSKALYQYVNYIDVTDWDNIGLMLDSRVRVNLGNYKKIGNYRLSFLREIFFNKLEKTDKGYLDFTTGDTPNFIPDKP